MALPDLQDERRTRAVHQSLCRTPRFAGVDRSFVVLEVTLVLALLVGLGPTWTTLVVGVLVVGGVHPLLVHLTRVDDMMTSFVARALTQRAHYVPRGSVRRAPRRPERAVPKR